MDSSSMVSVCDSCNKPLSPSERMVREGDEPVVCEDCSVLDFDDQHLDDMSFVDKVMSSSCECGVDDDGSSEGIHDPECEVHKHQ